MASKKLFVDPKESEEMCLAILNSIDKHKSSNNYDTYIEVSLILGNAYNLQGDFGLGILTLYETLDYCREDDFANRALINHLMASLYNSLNDSEKGLELMQTANSLYSQLKDSVGLALSCNVLGLIYINQKEYSKADSVFNLALKSYRQLEHEVNTAAVLNNMSLYDQDPLQKIAYLSEAIDINERYNRKWGLAENHNNLGMQYYYLGDYEKALQILREAYDMAIETNAKELISDNYRYQSWVHHKLRQYNQAYHHSVAADKIEKQIHSEQNIRNIERVIAQNVINKRRDQLQLMEETHKSKVIISSLMYFLIGVILLIVVMYGIYKKGKEKRCNDLYRAKLELEKNNIELLNIKLAQESLEKQEVETQLDASVRDLTSFSYYIKNKNEVFLKIKDDIKDVCKLEKDMMIKELKKIIVMINQYEQSDSEQAMMIKQVDKSNDDFLTKLEDLHPGISKTERKLASYLHMGMSTKEICDITGSNPKTINMTRYRLKKHLELDATVSLIEYLQNIV